MPIDSRNSDERECEQPIDDWVEDFCLVSSFCTPHTLEELGFFQTARIVQAVGEEAFTRASDNHGSCAFVLERVPLALVHLTPSGLAPCCFNGVEVSAELSEKRRGQPIVRRRTESKEMDSGAGLCILD
jgi:hypothetical protein